MVMVVGFFGGGCCWADTMEAQPSATAASIDVRIIDSNKQQRGRTSVSYLRRGPTPSAYHRSLFARGVGFAATIRSVAGFALEPPAPTMQSSDFKLQIDCRLARSGDSNLQINLKS